MNNNTQTKGRGTHVPGLVELGPSGLSAVTRMLQWLEPNLDGMTGQRKPMDPICSWRTQTADGEEWVHRSDNLRDKQWGLSCQKCPLKKRLCLQNQALQCCKRWSPQNVFLMLTQRPDDRMHGQYWCPDWPARWEWTSSLICQNLWLLLHRALKTWHQILIISCCKQTMPSKLTHPSNHKMAHLHCSSHALSVCRHWFWPDHSSYSSRAHTWFSKQITVMTFLYFDRLLF